DRRREDRADRPWQGPSGPHAAGRPSRIRNCQARARRRLPLPRSRADVGRRAAQAPGRPRDLRRPRGRAKADHEQALDPGLGQVPRADVMRVMVGGRTGLVLNHPTLNYVDAYSTKMFEYMALGIPVVCSDFPLWTEIVGGADCGITVDPRDPRAIADAIRAL